MKILFPLLLISINCYSQPGTLKSIKVGESFPPLTNVLTETSVSTMTNKSISDSLAMRPSNLTNTNAGFNNSHRDVAIGYPVPYIYPSTSNKSIAFDIAPSGNVSAGLFSHFDALDADVRLTNSADAHFGRLGAGNTFIEIGSYTLGAASLVPMEFTMNSQIGMTLTNDRKLVIGDASTTNFSLGIYVASNNPSVAQWYNSTTGTGANDGTKIGILADGETFLLNTENKPMSFWTNGTQRGSFKATGVFNILVTTNYADNAAALAGGLVAGDTYRTGDDLKVVH